MTATEVNVTHAQTRTTGSLCVAFALGLSGCSGSPPPITAPFTGSLTVSTLTYGSDRDPDGYVIAVDDGPGRPIGVNDKLTIDNIRDESHSLALGGVAANCTVQGTNPLSVTVASGGTTAAEFAVRCAALTGSLSIITLTSGDDQDLNGYLVIIDDGSGTPIGLNDTLTIAGIHEEPHDVTLGSVPANCEVEGTNPQTVALNHDTVATATFVVTCSAIAFVPMAEISAGAFHTCARTSAGAVYCWGDNLSGELGDGTNTARTTPTIVANGMSFSQISAGASFTCGRTAASEVYCWGSNSFGELGDGTTTDRAVPTPVNTDVPFVDVQVARDNGDYFSERGGCENYTGCGHACAVTATGMAYCWGSNNYGELGDGTLGGNRSEPAPVIGNLTFAAISVGGGHTCGVTGTGTAYCWGYNFSGQSGNGTSADFDEWGVPHPVTGDLAFAEISAGIFHTCGLTTSASAYCWGFNGTGQLGNGTQTGLYEFGIFSPPTPVTGTLTFTRIATGLYHSCGLTTSGTVSCWGYNGVGALGDGSTITRTVPTPVAGNLTFSAITGGWNHTCGLTSAGAVYCWGHNTSGQLGDGTYTARLVPTRIQT